MAHQLLRQPKLLVTALLLAPLGCLAPIDLDCDEPELSPSSVAETPMLEDLGVPVEDFIAELEEIRTGRLVAGDINGQLPAGQEPLDESLDVQIELVYGREGELVTPEDNGICELPHLLLPVTLTVRQGSDVLLTASGTGPVGWQAVAQPRADMEASFEPRLWDALGQAQPSDQEDAVASMFVFYRDSFADSIDIGLQRCDMAGCQADFAHIIWER